MQRRALLAGLGVLGTAGCVSGPLSREDGEPRRSESTADGVHQQTGSVLPPYTLPVGGAVPRSEQVVIRSADAATALLSDDEAVTEFVDGTEFEDDWLLVAVAGTWQSARPLTFAGLSENTVGWIAKLEIETPDGEVADDAVAHSLMARIPTAREPIAVVIDGEPTGTARSLADPVTLSLERTSIRENTGIDWIVEQVVRSPALRNALALTRRERTRSIRLRTGYRTVPPLNPEGTITIRFQGTAWEATLQE